MWFLAVRPLCFNDIFPNDTAFNHLAPVMIFLNVFAAQTFMPSVFAEQKSVIIIVEILYAAENYFRNRGLVPV